MRQRFVTYAALSHAAKDRDKSRTTEGLLKLRVLRLEQILWVHLLHAPAMMHTKRHTWAK